MAKTSKESTKDISKDAHKDKDSGKGEPVDSHILEELFEVIQSRKGGDAKKSYTAQLFKRGTGKIAQKVGEEAVETVIAATYEGKEELASESADLLYHLMVLWADRGITPDQVWEKLVKHRGVSGLVEKATRS